MVHTMLGTLVWQAIARRFATADLKRRVNIAFEVFQLITFLPLTCHTSLTSKPKPYYD